MRAVVDGRRAQESGRVVDRIAGQVLRLERLTVQDVVGDDAVHAWAHTGHQAHVSRPRGAREHALHAGSQHAALREPTQHRSADGGVPPVEGSEAIDADDDDARWFHGEKA